MVAQVGYDSKVDPEVAHIEGEDKHHIDAHEVVVDNDAAGYVDPTLVISEAENTRLRRRVHRRILPLLCLGYLCQALDKGTISSSSIMDWIEDVGAKGQDYPLATTMLWVGIIIAEPLANQGVRRLPLSKLLSGGILIWSALLFGLGFSLHVPTILGLRFMLGFFEALIGPVLVALTVQWYKIEEQPLVTTTWQCMLGLSNIILSVLSYAFYHIQDGALHSWQWLHVAIGIISVICSVIVFFTLPDSPTKARWASDHEKKLLVERVRSNNQGLRQKTFKKHQMIEAFTDPFSACLFFMCFFNTLVVGGIGTFGGLLINKAFGFTNVQAQLLNMPVGVMSMLSFIVLGQLVKRTGQTCLVMLGFCVPNIVGTIVLLTVAPSDKTKGGLVAAFYLMQIFGACYPAVLMLLSRNSAGQTKKSFTYAITFMGWAGGNAISPQLFQAKWAPRYYNSLYIHLGLYACFLSTVLATRWLLTSRNKRKIAVEEARIASGADDGPKNLHAFEDLTDIENPDFRYSV